MPEKNYHSLFQDILILLCYNNQAAPILVHSLKLEYFSDSCYRDIASKAIEYYLNYKKVIRTDLYTEFESVLNGKDAKKAARYLETLNNIYAHAGDDNVDYTLHRLDEFISRQEIELVFREGISLFEAGKAGNVDNTGEIRELFRKSNKQKASIFDPGIKITDVDAVLESLAKTELYVHTGIPELDRLGICPTPGEMLVITAPSGRGKTWFAGSLAKYAFLDRKSSNNPDEVLDRKLDKYKVCHISLEMSQGRTIQRYWQSFFAGSKYSEPQLIRYFGKDKDDRVLKEITDPVEVKPKLVLNIKDIDLEEKLRKKVSMLKHDNLIIKDFPTGQLTMNDLYAYLDSLETFLDFKPDILVLDYPDLMKLPADNLRIATGNLYKELRGLARERNMALIVPCQVNRAGDGISQLITRKFMGEDYSKIQTCDMHITYNQTEAERSQGLARLYIDKNRNGETGDLILISQNYAIGQFCIDSRPLNKKYNPATGQMDN